MAPNRPLLRCEFSHTRTQQRGLDMKKAGTRYLVQVRYAADEQDRRRILDSTVAIQRLLTEASDGETALAWSDGDGKGFGVFVRATLTAKALYDQLQSPTERNGWAPPSPMRNGDALMVIVVGEEFISRGFSKAATWLQHH